MLEVALKLCVKSKNMFSSCYIDRQKLLRHDEFIPMMESYQNGYSYQDILSSLLVDLEKYIEEYNEACIHHLIIKMVHIQDITMFKSIEEEKKFIDLLFQILFLPKHKKIKRPLVDEYRISILILDHMENYEKMGGKYMCYDFHCILKFFKNQFRKFIAKKLLNYRIFLMLVKLSMNFSEEEGEYLMKYYYNQIGCFSTASLFALLNVVTLLPPVTIKKYLNDILLLAESYFYAPFVSIPIAKLFSSDFFNDFDWEPYLPQLFQIVYISMTNHRCRNETVKIQFYNTGAAQKCTSQYQYLIESAVGEILAGIFHCPSFLKYFRILVNMSLQTNFSTNEMATFMRLLLKFMTSVIYDINEPKPRYRIQEQHIHYMLEEYSSIVMKFTLLQRTEEFKSTINDLLTGLVLLDEKYFYERFSPFMMNTLSLIENNVAANFGILLLSQIIHVLLKHDNLMENIDTVTTICTILLNPLTIGSGDMAKLKFRLLCQILMNIHIEKPNDNYPDKINYFLSILIELIIPYCEEVFKLKTTAPIFASLVSALDYSLWPMLVEFILNINPFEYPTIQEKINFNTFDDLSKFTDLIWEPLKQKFLDNRGKHKIGTFWGSTLIIFICPYLKQFDDQVELLKTLMMSDAVADIKVGSRILRYMFYWTCCCQTPDIHFKMPNFKYQYEEWGCKYTNIKDFTIDDIDPDLSILLKAARTILDFGKEYLETRFPQLIHKNAMRFIRSIIESLSMVFCPKWVFLEKANKIKPEFRKFREDFHHFLIDFYHKLITKPVKEVLLACFASTLKGTYFIERVNSSTPPDFLNYPGFFVDIKHQNTYYNMKSLLLYLHQHEVQTVAYFYQPITQELIDMLVDLAMYPNRKISKLIIHSLGTYTHIVDGTCQKLLDKALPILTDKEKNIFEKHQAIYAIKSLRSMYTFLYYHSDYMLKLIKAFSDLTSINETPIPEDILNFFDHLLKTLLFIDPEYDDDWRYIFENFDELFSQFSKNIKYHQIPLMFSDIFFICFDKYLQPQHIARLFSLINAENIVMARNILNKLYKAFVKAHPKSKTLKKELNEGEVFDPEGYVYKSNSLGYICPPKAFEYFDGYNEEKRPERKIIRKYFKDYLTNIDNLNKLLDYYTYVTSFKIKAISLYPFMGYYLGPKEYEAIKERTLALMDDEKTRVLALISAGSALTNCELKPYEERKQIIEIFIQPILLRTLKVNNLQDSNYIGNVAKYINFSLTDGQWIVDTFIEALGYVEETYVVELFDYYNSIYEQIGVSHLPYAFKLFRDHFEPRFELDKINVPSLYVFISFFYLSVSFNHDNHYPEFTEYMLSFLKKTIKDCFPVHFAVIKSVASISEFHCKELAEFIIENVPVYFAQRDLDIKYTNLIKRFDKIARFSDIMGDYAFKFIDRVMEEYPKLDKKQDIAYIPIHMYRVNYFILSEEKWKYVFDKLVMVVIKNESEKVRKPTYSYLSRALYYIYNSEDELNELSVKLSKGIEERDLASITMACSLIKNVHIEEKCPQWVLNIIIAFYNNYNERMVGAQMISESYKSFFKRHLHSNIQEIEQYRNLVMESYFS